jgi:hypothetical protein
LQSHPGPHLQLSPITDGRQTKVPVVAAQAAIRAIQISVTDRWPHPMDIRTTTGMELDQRRKTTATTDKWLAIMRDSGMETPFRIKPGIHDQVTIPMDPKIPVEMSTRYTTAYTATLIRFQVPFLSDTREMVRTVFGTNTNTKIIHRGLAETLVGDNEQP